MGAGELGGRWGGPRGEQNCGRLPSVTDPPDSYSNSSNKTSHKTPHVRRSLGRKMTGSRVVRGRPGRVHEDSGGDRRDAREQDAGCAAQVRRLLMPQARPGVSPVSAQSGIRACFLGAELLL